MNVQIFSVSNVSLLARHVSYFTENVHWRIEVSTSHLFKHHTGPWLPSKLTLRHKMKSEKLDCTWNQPSSIKICTSLIFLKQVKQKWGKHFSEWRGNLNNNSKFDEMDTKSKPNRSCCYIQTCLNIRRSEGVCSPLLIYLL